MPSSSGGTTLIIILVSVVLNASAQIFLRLGARTGFTLGDGGVSALILDIASRPTLWAGLASYALSLIAWIYVLSRAEASYAYPFLGLGFVLVALAGWTMLGETISPQRWVAIILIVTGILVLAKS